MYLDPGFGSMIIQIVVASFAALGAVFFVLKKKIINIFSKKGSKRNQSESNDGDKA